MIDKEKIKDWSVELPLLFVEYIRSEKMESYGSAKKDVENYLGEILEDVAVPRLIEVLKGDDTEEILSALERINEIAKDNLDMARPIKPYLEDLSGHKNKKIVSKAEKILSLFAKAERRKELAKRRKEMKKKEEQFLAGKISPEEYAKARKDYLEFRENR